MKKTYKTLDSELLLVESEGGFMESSVRIQSTVIVEEYKTFKQWDGGITDDSFDISFE